MTTLPQYNERAWAIDVIAEITQYCAPRSRAIVRAGGEYTVAGQSGNLFPDILLFGDSGGSVVLQGWELKMPDTPITDTALLQNAERKARRLGLNSFLIWNANEAALYVKSPSGIFDHCKSWPKTQITRRQYVRDKQIVWVDLLKNIIDDVNDLLDNGTVSGAKPNIAISDTLFIDYLNQYTSLQAAVIESKCISSATFSAEVDLWWNINKIEHPAYSRFEGLARVNIVNWINRFLFAHYLKRFHSAAQAIETITKNSNIKQAIAILDQIAISCDFMNVFKPALGQEYFNSITWAALISLNEFLTDFRLDTISQECFHQVLEGALIYSRKKLAGQFATPKALAELLVRVSIEDRTQPIMDPCCGTGTIVRAVYDLKRSLDLPISKSLESTWGSDKFDFPLQLSSIALSDPLGMGEVIQVFRQDAFDLVPGIQISFVDPNGNGKVLRNIPQMHAIVSNLPFVRFEDKAVFNPLISRVAAEIKTELGEDSSLDNRTDLYAYLILHFRHLIDESGRIGIIISNAWLGTTWGKQFRQIVSRYFKIVRIIVSGAGRWFSNSDVVTNVIVLEKRPVKSAASPNESIEFIATNERIDDWNTPPEDIANGIIVPGIKSTKFSRFTYTNSRISQLENIGFGWSSFFVNLDWVESIESQLVPVNRYLDIKRGERRGWDPLFYPTSGHGIEAEYIKPVLISPRDIDGLIAEADSDAFCCSDDIETLHSKQKFGALNWIRRFEYATNGKGNPLPEVLARSGSYWYEMKPSTMADFVLPMNPDKRLCVHKLKERSFVNQRLIRMTVKQSHEQIDNVLIHALMNSIVGIFQIEALGFGRGLGALDLNASKMEEFFHLLNPMLLSPQNRDRILITFKPLLNRNVYELPTELGSSDRREFDTAVLSAYGVAYILDAVYNSLLNLFKIRQTARS